VTGLDWQLVGCHAIAIANSGRQLHSYGGALHNGHHFSLFGAAAKKVPPLQPAFQKSISVSGCTTSALLPVLPATASVARHRPRDAVCRFETTRHVHPPPCSRSTASHLRTEYICLAVDARQWATEAGRMRVPTVNFAHFQCRPRATDSHPPNHFVNDTLRPPAFSLAKRCSSPVSSTVQRSLFLCRHRGRGGPS